jgi:cbb3-type cytochrome oxidase subunit 3
MLVPFASATGYATIVGSVSFAGVFVWWLLRAEARENTDEADEEATLEGDTDPGVRR